MHFLRRTSPFPSSSINTTRVLHHHNRTRLVVLSAYRSTPRTALTSHRNPATILSALVSIPKRLFSSFSPPSPEEKMAAKAKAQKLIDENAVVVFSKSYCPYCRSTKQLLSNLGAKYEVLELDQIDDGAAIQDALQEITNQRSVPNIFIAKEHIGGNSDIQGLGESKLKSKLTSAGAL